VALSQETVTHSSLKMGMLIISDRMSYMTLKGRSFDITVLNGHASTEDKSDDTKDNFMRYQSMYSIISQNTT
jgi:hypothetical protein